jgi:hypothetical protein
MDLIKNDGLLTRLAILFQSRAPCIIILSPLSGSTLDGTTGGGREYLKWTPSGSRRLLGRGRTCFSDVGGVGKSAQVEKGISLDSEESRPAGDGKLS